MNIKIVIEYLEKQILILEKCKQDLMLAELKLNNLEYLLNEKMKGNEK